MPYRDKSQIGRNLKRLRIAANLKQTELAEKAGLSRPHLSALENGRTTPEEKTILDILMHGFDMKPSDAKNMIAEWKVEEALSHASDPKKVVNNINQTFYQHDNSKVINTTESVTIYEGKND